GDPRSARDARRRRGRSQGRPGRHRRVQVGLPRRGEAGLQGRARPDRGHRAPDLGAQGRARVDARVPAEGLRDLPAQADAPVGRRARRDRLREHLLLPEAVRPERALLGRRAGGHQEHVREARHPGGGAQVPGGRRRPVRVRGGLPLAPEGPGGEGRDLPRHRRGAPAAPRALPRVLGDRHPGQRQQVRGPELGRLVRRLLHLRPAGRQGRAAAAGLLPDQRPEHGPVRADADHRRRGRLRALRRGLHRADVLERLAALGRRRDHRQEGRPLPLHDHPELVEQRLQPGHEARRGARGRDHGVGRRQPRLQADDEVPGRHPEGRARPRRGALDRLRRRGAA
ncbi:MAG: Iron-sulfur cluster assembly protein SufB, partial [uncultured Thermoleophilia bacterium]